MPLVRFKIRNELSLGGPELNRSAAVEYEEPKAILGAVEVAGLVGILRQLGDLAEFSAEVFNGIQEEVTVTASRCQKLTSRVKRIESALSPLEKAVLSQTSHIHFAYTAGCEWHPRIRNGQRHFVQSDLPLCVMESYEQCRDPPPLHLLDRFDAGGPGSCLRKYSDPTFFRKESGNPSKAGDVKAQRDQTHRKRKKKRLPQRNICRSRAVSTSDETNGAHLSSLTDDRPTTSQSTSTVDMPRSSNMQDLSDIIDQSHLQEQSHSQEQSEAQVQSDLQESSKPRDSITGSGYIEYVINQSPVDKPDVKLLEGFLSSSLQPADRIGSAVPGGRVEVVDDNILYSPSEDIPVPYASIVCDEKKETLESRVEKSNKDVEASEIHESKIGPGTPDRVRQNQRDFDRTYDFFDEVDTMGEKQSKSQANSIDGNPGIESEGENKSEQGSEADEFVDARNTIESESDSELDGVPKPKLEHYFGDISTYCSEDASSDNNGGSEDIPYEEMVEDPRHDNSLDESCSGSYLPDNASVSCCQSDPVCGKILSHDETFQKPREFSAMPPSLLAEGTFPDETILREPVAADPVLAGDCANEKISFEELISSDMSLKDAIPAEKVLPEEHLAKYPSLAEAVPHEKILPGESVAKYQSFAEIVPPEKNLPDNSLPKIPSLAEAVPDNITPAEEPGAAHPSVPKAVQEKKIPPEVLDSEKLSVPEAVSQEQASLEESVGIHPCLAEVVPDERFLTENSEELGTTCLPSSIVTLIEKILPEKPSEAHHYLAEMPQEKILPEKSVDSSLPSLAASPEENLSSEVLDSTDLSLAEAVSQEQIGLEEFDGIYPCLAEAVPDDRFLTEEREEAATICVSPSKGMPIEKLLPEQSLEGDHYLAELPQEKILPEKSVDPAHPSCAKAALPEENLSPEFVGIDACLVKAVPDERVLPEESVTTCVSLSESVAIEKTLPEECLETYSSLAGLPEEKISHEESDDATHASKAVSDEKISPDVSGYTNFSSEEALPQEKISVEEFVGIDPCLAEVDPYEKFLPEEPVITCLSLEKAATIEGVLPEKPLETYPSFAELPEEKIVHEEADDATHLSVSEAGCDEKVSPEALDSTYFPVAAALQQEQILLEEFVSNPCLTEAVPDERVLPEEPVTTCLSLKKAATIEGVLPEKPLETYPPFAELPEEKIVHEEADDATNPSVSEAVCDEQISPEVLDPTFFPVAAALPQEQILLEEFVGNPYLAEAVLDRKVLPQEPVTPCMSLTEPEPIQGVLPEEPLEAHASLEKSSKNKISQEKSDDGTHPSCAKAESDKNFSPEVFDSENLSVAEAIPQEKFAVEEFVGMDTCFAEAVPDETVLPEEAVTTRMSLTKEAPTEKILPEEPLDMYPSLEELPEEKMLQEEEPDDGTDPYFSEAVGDERTSSLEHSCSAYPSLEESVSHEETAHEEIVGTDPFMELAVPDVSSFPDRPGGTYHSSAEADSEEKTWSEELLPDEKISLDEPDATCPPSAEAVFDEKISGSEALGFTAEAGPHNTEEPDATCPPSAEAVFDEKISGSEVLGYRTEAGPHNTEEPDATCPSSAEAVFDEKISGSEAPGYITEAGPHSTEEPVATDLSLTEAVFDEKIPGLEALASTRETGPHNKTLPEEPVATCLSLAEPVPNDSVLPKEPAAAYLDLSEGIPDQQVFLDDAAFLSFAEAIFDQKFSPEVPDPMDLPAKNILVKEGEAYDEHYTASNVSVNPKSGFSKPKSADRTIRSNGGTVTISPDTQESLSNGAVVESVNIWSNGGLLGLAPSKPPVFAEPNSVSEHIQNEINEASVLATRKQESSSRSVEDTEKNSLPLVVTDPTSQQQRNMLSHSNGSLSHLQSTATSFKVFGLSHRLLMAGFRGNSSSTCKFESIPTSSYDTKAAAIEDKTQQTLGGSSFEEQLAYESSIFGSPTSSPPVEHMKISFNPIDPSPASKLKLRIPSQPQNNGENADMFPSFQLVPEASNSDGDDDSDIFCQSSPCVSDNCLSDSELWESDESPRESASSLKQVGERHGDMGSFSGSFLDLPCFDSVDHQSTSSRPEQEQEQERVQVPEYKPSVSEIIRDWPPNQPKSCTSIEADANAILKKTQNQSVGL